MKKNIYKFNKNPPKKQPKKLKVKVSSSTTLEDELNNIYNLHGDLSTTCLRQCNCCRVACPQMNYSEAISIIDNIWSKWNKEDKIKLLTTAIKYFFSRSLIKPCPMLKGKECLIYSKRPLGCRLFGLWPRDIYEKRVELISNVLKLPKEKIPLNRQCRFVKRKNKQPLSNEQINEMYQCLEKIDLHLLMKEELEKKEEWKQKINKKWSYRTIHDWLLFIFFGEDWLVKLTSYSLAAKKEDLEDFINILKDLVPKVIDKKIT